MPRPTRGEFDKSGVGMTTLEVIQTKRSINLSNHTSSKGVQFFHVLHKLSID